jgi:Spy/CpxP family protein refolding chaperone
VKSIRFRLLIAAVAVLLGTAISKSQTAADAPAPPPMHGPRHAFGMADDMRFFAERLNLSDDQREQMKTILHKEHQSIKPLFEQAHQIDLQLRQYAEGTYEEKAVRALAAQKAQVEVELAVHHTRVHNELFQVLTADQQAKMKEMEAQHEARMQQHMHDAPPAPPEQ